MTVQYFDLHENYLKYKEQEECKESEMHSDDQIWAYNCP